MVVPWRGSLLVLVDNHVALPLYDFIGKRHRLLGGLNVDLAGI